MPDRSPGSTRSRMAGALLRIRDAGYLQKWLVLGALIGVVAGLGAVAFIRALEVCTKLLLDGLGGYTPPSPVGEGNAAGSAGFARPWAIPLVVALGGLVSAFLTQRLAPEAEGHGTDAAIQAVHHNPRGIRARVVGVKLVASAITIGAGGSAGREGPTAQISGGFGSLLGRALKLSPSDARIAVAAGIGSGIGAIFRAPLGGALLGAEILYRDDLEGEAIMPSLIASVVGFSIFGAVEGFTPIFGFLRGYTFEHPVRLLYFALLGVVAGAVGRLYSKSFYGTTALTHRLPGSPLVKAGAAGLLVGLLGLAVPGALGTGYGFVQKAMTGADRELALWVIVALPFVKILATSLTVGSGASGGIFGPGMVIGAFVGASVWQGLHPFAPSLPDSPAPFIVVGMVACFGSIAHAPLGMMLMVAEMTGTLALLPPAMVALGTAGLVVGEATIYRAQLKDRVESRAHRLKFGLPLLASVPVQSVMRPPRLVLPTATPALEAMGLLRELDLTGAPVIGEDGAFRGGIDTDRLATQLREGDTRTISELADLQWPTLTVEATTLEDVVEALVLADVAWIGVLDAGHRWMGIVGLTEVMDGYRRALWSSLGRLRSTVGQTVLVEDTVTDGSILAGTSVAHAKWPPGAIVVSIQRGRQLVFPEGDTVLEPGDVLSVLARPGSVGDLHATFGASPLPGPDGPRRPGPEGP